LRTNLIRSFGARRVRAQARSYSGLRLRANLPERIETFTPAGVRLRTNLLKSGDQWGQTRLIAIDHILIEINRV